MGQQAYFSVATASRRIFISERGERHPVRFAVRPGSPRFRKISAGAPRQHGGMHRPPRRYAVRARWLVPSGARLDVFALIEPLGAGSAAGLARGGEPSFEIAHANMQHYL